jgi:hypothetical protein
VPQLSTDDRLALTELVATYCTALDLGRWEEFRSLFTEDCRLDLGEAMGLFEGSAGVRRFTDTMAGMGLFMRHYVTNLVLRGDGTQVRGESYVLAITGPPGASTQTTGRYEDEFVKVGGRWLIRIRRALLDYRH